MSAGTRPRAGAGRPRGVPVWKPLEWPEAGLATVPGLHPGSDEERGGVIALRATPGAREGGWSARAAAAIAGAGAAQGARVLLADLFLDGPHLHEAFGEPNLEGVTDLVGYGASLGRIARAAHNGGFRVATAGTPVADSAAVFDQPRWRRLVESLVEEGVTLFAYQPAELAILPRGTPSIVLARKGEPMTALGAAGLRDAVAVLGPPRNAAAAADASVAGAGTLASQGYRALLWDGPEDEARSGEEAPRPDATEPGAGAEPAAAPDAGELPGDGEQQAPAAEPKQPSAGEPEQPPAAEPEQPPAVAAEAPAPEPSGEARPESVPGARGRGLSISAFVVLVLFAAVMILMGIDNAGIAEVPGADRLRELFEGLLAWISGFFAR